MSQLADLLETHAERLLRRWSQRLYETITQDGKSESQLIAHAPDLLLDLRAALRQGRTQATNPIAQVHCPQRYRIGFSLNALVRETALLSECIVDLAEETGTAVTVPELRVLNHFIVTVIAEGVREHGQCAFELRKRQGEFTQQILRSVSHELRNPLGVIQMSATLLSYREDLDEPAQKTVARIQCAALRVTRLVNDLRDFTQARLGAGIRVTLMPVDLHAVTQVVVEDAAAAYPTGKVAVLSSGNGKGHWDEHRIGQVVHTMVTHALKYGSEETLVQVVTRGESDSVTLSVHNHGKPIPPEWIASVFRPMPQVTDAVDESGHSMVLSLYIMQCIVDAHHGRIGITSTAAAGTSFTMWLPRTVGD